MFQLIETTNAQLINESIAYFTGDYKLIYDKGTIDRGLLYIERCEFGKNINSKYMNLLKSALNFGRPIEEFYCISSKSGNVSLFYNPNIGYSLINLNIMIKKNSHFIPEKIQSLIVSENNIIDHTDKNKPINEGFIYHTTSSFNSLEFTEINYVIQCIKYESDDGLFYKSNKTYNGISFFNMAFNRKMKDNYDLQKDLENNNISNIGSITFEINKANYDYYKRIYQRFQSLLAEIMSVINLVFEVGRQISFFLCNKKMSTNIIRTLLDKENYYILNQNNNKKNNLHKSQEENKLSSDRKIINNELMDKKNNTYSIEKNDIFKLNITKDFDFKITSKNEMHNLKKNNNQVLNKINYYHILKSFLCFKDKKTKLINLCHTIILQDLCIERILERFYNLEKIYQFFKGKEKEKIECIKTKRFKEINKYIYMINHEMKEYSIKKV